MKIMVSACLLGENCKYNGGNNYNEKIRKMIKENEVISICPELLGGLPTPRKPAEIVNGVVSTQDGIFAAKLIEHGMKVIDVEDID